MNVSEIKQEIEKEKSSIEASEARLTVLNAMLDSHCRCEHKECTSVVYRVLGYGRELSVDVNFNRKSIEVHYDHSCDEGDDYRLPISYCPFCGRKLDSDEDTEK